MPARQIEKDLLHNRNNIHLSYAQFLTYVTANKLYFIRTCTIHSHLEMFETMVQTDMYETFEETIPKMNSQDRVRHITWKKASFNNMRFPYLDYVGVQMSCLCWTGSLIGFLAVLILLPVWIKPLQLLNWEMKNHKYFPMTLKYESSINLIKWQMLRHIASNADKGVSLFEWWLKN